MNRFALLLVCLSLMLSACAERHVVTTPVPPPPPKNLTTP